VRFFGECPGTLAFLVEETDEEVVIHEFPPESP
jgi:hypothetical protein